MNDDQRTGEGYLELRRVRLERLVRQRLLLQREADLFAKIEDGINHGSFAEDWLRSFHLSNDSYLHLLEKVLKALVKVREPHAAEKLKAFVEEKGTMSPAVFLTPWDLTLAYLDSTFGTLEELRDFYA